MTLVTATQYDGPICCSVDVVGMSNLATFLENTSGYRQDLRRVEYGDERDSTQRAWMERTAPLNRSEEHTSELQSQSNLVCRLLLEKKKNINTAYLIYPPRSLI